MPQRLSSILNISPKFLEKKGVFNSFVDIDSNLYVDPSLLENIQIPEFTHSYEKYREYFANVLTIIENSKSKQDRFWREAFQRLQFPEFKYAALGYSVNNKSGNAIGPEIAARLLETSSEIIKAGIKDPIIFELIGLFEKGVGADRISDMTIHIIKDDLIKYTQRVSQELKIHQKKFISTNLPFNEKTGEPVIFIPKGLLQDLPIAFCWDDIDRVCRENDELRKRVNNQIGYTWKYATTKITKGDLKRTLLENPEVFKDLISQYRKKSKTPYDFEADRSGQVIWAGLSERAAKEYPLNLATPNLKSALTNKKVLEIVTTICEQYARLIENNGWYEFLYDNTGKLRNERFAQKLFYGIADQYCLANDLNLSREPNAGSGALDFKITRGYKIVVTVEVKYSSNTSLIKGYTKQLPAYNKAENAQESIYLILRTTKSDTAIKEIERLNKSLRGKGQKVPDIITIDARPQVSASKRK